MSDYLYYCPKCNSLIADKYEDDDIACECGAKMFPLHIDEDDWNGMSDDDKWALLDRYKTPQPQVQKRRPVSSSTAYQSAGNNTKQTIDKDYQGRFSTMSIAAFICSFFGIIGIVGIVLGVIDLQKKDGRKRGLAIAAIIIGVIMTLGTFSAIGSDSTKEDKTIAAETTESEEVAEAPEKEEIAEVNEEPEPENVAEETENIETKPEITEDTNAKEDTIELVAGELGEYGETITFNEDDDLEDVHYVYHVPIGKYEATNIGDFRTQVNVCSDEIIINEDGWEEYADAYVELLEIGETKTISVKKGYHIDIDEPSHLSLKKINDEISGESEDNKKSITEYDNEIVTAAKLGLDNFISDYDLSLAPQKWTIAKFDETDTTVIAMTDISYDGKKGKYIYVGTLNIDDTGKVNSAKPHYLEVNGEVLGDDGYATDVLDKIKALGN